jgi:hypothetical protein
LKNNEGISAQINNTAPWKTAENLITTFPQGGSEAAIAEWFEKSKAFLVRCRSGEDFGSWLSTWSAMQATGFIWELHEHSGRTFKEVCENYEYNYDYELSKSHVYRLIHKYKRLCHTAVGISLLLKWRTKLEDFLASDPKEAEYWRDELIVAAPFGYVAARWWTSGMSDTLGKDKL